MIVLHATRNVLIKSSDNTFKKGVRVRAKLSGMKNL